MKKIRRKIYPIGFIAAIMFSCADFVALEPPKSQIASQSVFTDDVGVRSAITAIFSQMISSSAFASGGSASVGVVTGLTSDELINYSSSPDQIALYTNSILPTNTFVQNNWDELYLYIYESNSILEGIQSSTGLSKEVKDHTRGEALFIRSFCYFYLVNFFGDVPLILGTDYRVNRVAVRTPVATVYSQIVADLLEAKTLLAAGYSVSDGDKIEPNKDAASALLARVYLYTGKWNEAEVEASSIIDNGTYVLVDDLTSVFLKNSEEAIWQLMPTLPGLNTNEAQVFIITTSASRYSLSPSLVSAFDDSDARKVSWIGTATVGGKTYSYPFKYKVRLRNQPVTEYSMVFRLAEQYLIRSEARANQSKISEAVEDLNAIRTRAGISLIDASGLSQGSLLTLIEDERRLEFFTEWGHRWLDLKRTGRADAVLGPAKVDWQSRDALFPIPQSEITANPNLTQNL